MLIFHCSHAQSFYSPEIRISKLLSINVNITCWPIIIYYDFCSNFEATVEKTHGYKETEANVKAKFYVDRCSIYKTASWHLGPTYIYFNGVLRLTPRKNIISDKLIVSQTFSKFLYVQLNFYTVFTKTSN